MGSLERSNREERSAEQLLKTIESNSQENLMQELAVLFVCEWSLLD